MSIITNLKTDVPLAFKIVFSSNPLLHIGIAAIIFTIFWIVSSMFDGLLFFSPILIFYLPDDAVIGFILTNITSALIGIVSSMNMYVLRHSNLKLDKSLLFGFLSGIASSACASCSSIGFLIISTFGSFGIVATTFLTNYQTSLRMVSIGIMVWALFSVQHRITKTCFVDNLKKKEKRINMS